MQKLECRTLYLAFLIFSCALTTPGECRDPSAPTEFSDDDLEIMGKASASIINSSVDSMGTEEATAPSESNIAGALIEGLENIPKPVYQREQLRKDVSPICERDYSQLCPVNFSLVGRPRGDGLLSCAATASYEGPCLNDFFIPAYVVGELARESWARRCHAEWPCKLCNRDFGAQCPTKWDPVAISPHKCSSPRDYRGPCPGTVDFSNMTILQKKQWSASCMAWWPCTAPRQLELGPDADMPLTRKATLWRVLQGYQ